MLENLDALLFARIPFALAPAQGRRKPARAHDVLDGDVDGGDRHALAEPQIYWVAPVPIVTAVVSLSLLHGILNASNSKPFWLSIALFFLGMSGLGVTIWPYVVPPGLNIWTPLRRNAARFSCSGAWR